MVLAGTPFAGVQVVPGTCRATRLDAFDQLAWDAAKDVLEFEEKMPGQQDPAVLGAALRVLQLLSDGSREEPVAGRDLNKS